MGTINVTLGEDTKLNLILGQQLENAVTSVVFDFSAWQTTYGSGTLALSVQRPGDEQPYAVTMTTSGTNATWSVTNLDTAYKGVGHIQLTYTVGSAIKKSVVYKFTVYESLGANGEYPSPGQTWQEEIEDELADVKDDLAELEGGGLSDDAKQALLACFQNVAWKGTDGDDYYQDLYDALYPPVPPATLTSITCVYTQSGTVYDTDTLESLKSDLVVTAHYEDSTTQTVTAYTLSGTLTAGTSTITVSYNGKTTSFNVTVTHATQDTTAEVIRSGVVLSHVTYDPYYKDYSQTNGGVTKIYDMDAPTTVLYPAGIIPTDGNVMKSAPAALYVCDASGDPINFVSEASVSSFNRWAQDANGSMTEYSYQWTVDEYSKIQFSVDIRYLDDAYMYDKTTGQVWFAGINTPYYGMTNISQANS